MTTDGDASVLFLDAGKLATVDCGARKTQDENELDPSPGGWSPILVLAGATCCLGSALPAGFNIGVINNPAKLMKVYCNETIEEQYKIILPKESLEIIWSAVVSIFLIGGVTGSLTAGWLADKIGRKGALSIGNLCGIIGAILFLTVKTFKSVEVLMLGRAFVGLSGGLATSLVPMYMTETAPVRLRGAVGVLCQLGITCGVLMGQIAGLDTVLGTEESWHIMLASFSPLCLLALLLMFILPESPKYLYVIKGQQRKALEALSRLRGLDAHRLQAEVSTLHQEVMRAESTETWTIGRVVKEPSLRLPLILVCLMQFGQQLSGINAVFVYSNIIFDKAGLGTTGSQYATLGTGVINILMALISVPIMLVFGRRTLLLLSCYLCIGCLVVLSIAMVYVETVTFMPWLCIIAVLAYVLFYGIGLGPIPYFIGSELFDVGPRSAAMALGSVFNWGGNFIVSMTFPSLQSAIEAYSFLVFAGFTLMLALFNRLYLPETQGRNTTDIASTLTQGLKSRPNNAYAV